MSLPLGDLNQLGSGTGNYCLAPAAAAALAQSGITLKAVAPAKLVDLDGRPCVSTPILGGSFSPDFAEGDISFDGGFEFVHSDGRRLVMTGLKGNVGTGRVAGDVRGSGSRRFDVLAFVINPVNMHLTPTELKAHISFTLTHEGADAFDGAFGSTPVRAGDEIFDGSGKAKIKVMSSGLGL